MTPAGAGLFAFLARHGETPLFFTAQPYIQPGANSKLVAGRESLIVAWQTEHIAASFKTEYGVTKKLGKTATIARVERFSGNGNAKDNRYNYAATLENLPLGKRVFYRVSCNGAIVAEGYSTTRRPSGQKIRFVAFGDNSCGERSDRAIAYQAWSAHPDFVMNTGDNVYDSGLDSEYARYFFPVYNAPKAGPDTGAPLLRSVPFYTVIANHDVSNRDANGHSVADFDKSPGSLAYYTNMHLPLNGFEPSQPTPIVGTAETLAGFKRAAGARFPKMANYSFDYGDAHFCCIDSNLYIDPTDPALHAWLEGDLSATDAIWKFVVYHHPAFNAGDGHYDQQHMRALAPLFEKHGVDFVLNGHEHTYQRPQPLRFQPADLASAKNVGARQRYTPGKWKVDRVFDGKTHTQPNGVLHIVTGAGGNHLYDTSFTGNPAKWRHKEDGNIAYVTQFISDRHSLSVFEIEGRTLVMKQVDEWGQTVDAIRVTK